MSTPVLETVPLIPARRSRSPDIIDVDLLDDAEIAASQRPLQRRRRDVIDIEEIIELPAPQSGSSSSRYRSPPPPRHSSPVPPVPSVPRHLRGMASPPLLRRAPQFPPPGVVRPTSQPFAFEASLGSARRISPSPPQTSSAASSPSHHVPVMGFGGALLAMNAQNNRDTNRPTSHRRAGALRHRIRHIPALSQATDYIASSLRLIVGRMHGDRDLFSEDDDELLEDLDFYNFAALAQRRYDHSESTTAAGVAKGMEYKREFTHPGKMPTDFARDFGPPNDPITLEDGVAAGPSSAASSSSSSVDSILVCAQCLDPLVIGGVPDSSATSRRLWALRCGHILDGKCVERLMKPDDEVEGPTSVPSEDKSSEYFGSSPKPGGKGEEVEFPPVPSQPPGEAPRSVERTRRLRSGRTLPTMDEFNPYHHERPPRRRKGKAKMRMPVVEREYDWRCPVSGCGKVHQSVLISGRWKMHQTSGAITMYV